ncbi:MAG: hypothetical protein KA236_04550 [Verrucomicrobia bacterium]|nr:hypothetical protein [Verrucomicrobiota bacterium]
MKRCATFTLLLGLATGVLPANEAALPPGLGSFVFQDPKVNPEKPVTVWYYRPETWAPSQRVLFVMPGMERDAERYRQAWLPPAREHQVLLLVPEFSKQHYPSAAYQRGGVSRQTDESQWTFALIEKLFDHVRAATGLERTNYLIYGHSGGGQFVHRLVQFMPHARFERAVAANPGYYTMPTFEKNFPYGFKESPMTDERLRRAFSRPLIILLGDQDTDPDAANLNRSAEAMAQGRHRFERGQHFYAAAKKLAAERAMPCQWQMKVVPGVGHSNAGMTAEAAKILFAPRPTAPRPPGGMRVEAH